MEVNKNLIIVGATLATMAAVVLVGFATHDLWKDGIGTTRADRPTLAQDMADPEVRALPGETDGLPFSMLADQQPIRQQLQNPKPTDPKSMPAQAAQPVQAAFQGAPQQFAGVQPSPVTPQFSLPEQQQNQVQPRDQAPNQPTPQPWQRQTTAGAAARMGDVKPMQMVDTAQPTPPNYIPKDLLPYEIHWQGLDARQMTTELARKLQMPLWLEGLMVGEVTMNAADSGMLGGDVIVALEDQPIVLLTDLHKQSRIHRHKKSVKISVFRKRKKMVGNEYAMRRLTFVMHGNPDVGLAQLEGAPMIMPGDPRPHSDRGPCTKCHAIGKGFELTPDPDLITLPPPPILKDVALREARPHEDRGPCVACHVIQ
ncbi:magnetosome magnetite formation protein MamP [Magnetospira sp. QH-2]|uniref:magnetosome magnetite formation protein MamP n=1 Tax=Magnetospira sp. (strain QH-2) TaxID=1288970 RepID=UPI0003E810C8|nr:magnetosome magnetite formation protein MamP [Magnetospira sp. QH-2]CCQ72997.1 Magnetosome protein MamP [Magnetospira sp. QH-2]